MATAPIASFGPTAAIEMAVTPISTNVALPTTGTPSIALVSNLSQQVVFVALGASAVAAAIGTSLAILPQTQVALTIGTNTNLAAVTLAGLAGLNIAVGN